MKAGKKILVLLITVFLLSVLPSCTEIPSLPSEGSATTIRYEESKMSEFSKRFKETKEIYIESSNGTTKTAIDIQSGNSYEETVENGKVEQIYFQNQSNGQTPVGVYRLFEKNQIPCYYPIEGDATIDMYKLLASMGNVLPDKTVQISYDGANRKESIEVMGEVRTMIFWGETSIPISAGLKNDMEDFMINFNVLTEQIPNAEMKKALENGLSGRSLYIPYE